MRWGWMIAKWVWDEKQTLSIPESCISSSVALQYAAIFTMATIRSIALHIWRRRETLFYQNYASANGADMGLT